MHDRAVRSFLLEEYLAPAASLDALAQRAEAIELEHRPVRYLGSIFLPHDEVCFHLFAAPSAAAVRTASDSGRLAYDRIVETIWIPRT